MRIFASKMGVKIIRRDKEQGTRTKVQGTKNKEIATKLFLFLLSSNDLL